MLARTLGPFYRITIRDRDAEGQILAVSSGFTVPAMGLMHCDSLQIFTRGVKGAEGERVRGGALGLGLLMGGAVFSLGHSSGCKKAEILAIKDDGGGTLTPSKGAPSCCMHALACESLHKVQSRSGARGSCAMAC